MIEKPQRRKIQREYITKAEKRVILAKSKCKCSHCGKLIELGKNFSVEHVIPLSRGGSNDLDNLVGLCKDCNKTKGNFLLCSSKEISSYYSKLTPNAMSSLLKYCKEYIEKYQFLDWDNWFLEDSFSISPADFYRKPKSTIFRNGRAQYIDKSELLYFNSKYLLRKANYDDLDNLLNFYVKAYPNMQRDEIESIMGKSFLIGIYYILTSLSGTILGAFHIELTMNTVASSDPEQEDMAVFCSPLISSIAMVGYTHRLFIPALCKIVSNISDVTESDYIKVGFLIDKDSAGAESILATLTYLGDSYTQINPDAPEDLHLVSLYGLIPNIKLCGKISKSSDSPMGQGCVSDFLCTLWDNRKDYLDWVVAKSGVVNSILIDIDVKLKENYFTYSKYVIRDIEKRYINRGEI